MWKSTLLFVLALTWIANGQSFSFLTDTLQPRNGGTDFFHTKVKIINNTINKLTIDSIFLHINQKPMADVNGGFGIYTKNDSLIIGCGFSTQKLDTIYGPFSINSKDTVIVDKLGALDCDSPPPCPNYVLIQSPTISFARLIFKSGQSLDTLTVMGRVAGLVNIKPANLKTIGPNPVIKTPSQTYNIRGQRVPQSVNSSKKQLRIIKNGTVIYPAIF